MDRMKTNLLLLIAVVLACAGQWIGTGYGGTWALILYLSAIVLATAALFFTLRRKNFAKQVMYSILALWVVACIAVMWRMYR